VQYYGDGWDGNILHVGTQTFALPNGYNEGTATACLDPGTTYTPYACDGSYDSEVSWSVGGVSGGADNSCSGSESFYATSVPSLEPTVTVSPTAPTSEPTHAPTSVTGVTTVSEFNAAASASNSIVTLAADISTILSTDGLMISGVTNIVVDGAGKKLMGKADLYTFVSGNYSHKYAFGIGGSKVIINDFILHGAGFGGIRAIDSTVTLN